MEVKLRGQSVCQYAFALAPQPHLAHFNLGGFLKNVALSKSEVK